MSACMSGPCVCFPDLVWKGLRRDRSSVDFGTGPLDVEGCCGRAWYGGGMVVGKISGGCDVMALGLIGLVVAELRTDRDIDSAVDFFLHIIQ